MDIVKIIGVGLIALIIIIILKQYKPDFVIYVSIIAGALILFMVLDKLTGIIELLSNLSNKARNKQSIFRNITKDNRDSIFDRICSKYM